MKTIKLEDDQGIYAKIQNKSAYHWEDGEGLKLITPKELLERLESYMWGKDSKAYKDMVFELKYHLGLV